MVLHRKGWLVRRRPIARSRSLRTASWRMSTIFIRIIRHIQACIFVTTRYRHLTPLPGGCGGGLPPETQL